MGITHSNTTKFVSKFSHTDGNDRQASSKKQIDQAIGDKSDKVKNSPSPQNRVTFSKTLDESTYQQEQSEVSINSSLDLQSESCPVIPNDPLTHADPSENEVGDIDLYDHVQEKNDQSNHVEVLSHSNSENIQVIEPDPILPERSLSSSNDDSNGLESALSGSASIDANYESVEVNVDESKKNLNNSSIDDEGSEATEPMVEEEVKPKPYLSLLSRKNHKSLGDLYLHQDLIFHQLSWKAVSFTRNARLNFDKLMLGSIKLLQNASIPMEKFHASTACLKTMYEEMPRIRYPIMHCAYLIGIMIQDIISQHSIIKTTLYDNKMVMSLPTLIWQRLEEFEKMILDMFSSSLDEMDQQYAEQLNDRSNQLHNGKTLSQVCNVQSKYLDSIERLSSIQEYRHRMRNESIELLEKRDLLEKYLRKAKDKHVRNSEHLHKAIKKMNGYFHDLTQVWMLSKDKLSEHRQLIRDVLSKTNLYVNDDMSDDAGDQLSSLPIDDLESNSSTVADQHIPSIKIRAYIRSLRRQEKMLSKSFDSIGGICDTIMFPKESDLEDSFDAIESQLDDVNSVKESLNIMLQKLFISKSLYTMHIFNLENKSNFGEHLSAIQKLNLTDLYDGLSTPKKAQAMTIRCVMNNLLEIESSFVPLLNAIFSSKSGIKVREIKSLGKIMKLIEHMQKNRMKMDLIESDIESSIQKSHEVLNLYEKEIAMDFEFGKDRSLEEHFLEAKTMRVAKLFKWEQKIEESIDPRLGLDQPLVQING